MIKIDFCIQIKNRLWQLKQTLPVNLELIAGTNHRIILLDIDSDDGIDEFISTISSPNFLYFKKSFAYSIPKAKNTVIKKATGDIIVSLDADNYITQNWLDEIIKRPTEITHNWSGISYDGTYGRISCPRKKWTGFKETYLGCGRHDLDFVNSNTHYKVPFIGQMPIKNTKDDTKRYTKQKDWTWREIVIENSLIDEDKKDLIVELKPDIVGPKGGHVSIRQFKETKYARLDYIVNFSDDFDFGKGGKLPGLAGGDMPRGKRSFRGFSSRLMWRTGGAAEVYYYDSTVRDGDSGKSNIIDFNFCAGSSYLITQVFNRGIINTFINGENKTTTRVNYKTSNGLLKHIFRGGSTQDWSSKNNSIITISNISIRYCR